MRAARALSAALLLVAGCASAIRTRYDAAPDADFGRYQTYAWIHQDPDGVSSRSAASGSGFVSALDDRRLREAVDAELHARGYRQASDFELADLVVRYQVGREEKVQVSQEPGVRTYYPSGYGYGSWYGQSAVRVSTYLEGTLTIEFYDHRTRQAVWVGWAQKRLSRNDDSASLIKRAVDAVLAPLPPAGG